MRRTIGRHCRRGSVSLVAAMMLPALVGMTGLGAEYAYALMAQSYNQRVADMAAYSGALAYNKSSSTTTLTAAVNAIAGLNGIGTSNITSSLVTSPTNSGNQAVLVTVSTTAPLVVSGIVGAKSSVAVVASAYAELSSTVAGCIIALKASGTGVTLSGGTSVTASSCKVASNNTVTVPCGTVIKAVEVDYNSAAVPTQGCSGIESPSGGTGTVSKKATSDPLAGNSYVSTATGHISTVSLQATPTAPSGSSVNDLSFGYSGAPPALVSAGCPAPTFASNTWTVTCPAGTYNFRNLSLSGGITVNFNKNSVVSPTFNFSGSVNDSGAALNFGPGTYNIAQGIITGGGSTTTFGAGTFNIGPATSTCGSGKYSICNQGTSLTFGGPSTFNLAAGIYNSGGSTITFGSGTTNSYWIGPSSDGNALYAGGGSTMTFADATGSGDLFQVSGTVNASSGGGSCLTLPAAAAHDINGSVTTAGGMIMGAGVYTINGYFAAGASGGGDVTCGGAAVGVSGTNVTLVVSGSSTPSSGTCNAQAFCIAAGFSHVTLTAPTTGATPNLLVLGPNSSSNTSGATFTEGASNTSLSGVFYLPYGPVTMGGGSSVGNGTGQCLELIGSQITLTGGSTLATTCTGLGASNATAVSLVQ